MGVDPIKDFWTDLNWLAIALSILTPLLALLLWIYRIPLRAVLRARTPRYPNITSFASAHAPPDTTVLDSLKADLTLAVIDDDLDDFPIEYLRRIGYTVYTYESVSLSQQRQLSAHSLVLLDIKGVVQENLETGGFTLLERMKGENPSILTIAVSGKSFQPSLNQFFAMADFILEKPIYPEECEEAVSRVLLRAHSPHHAAATIDSMLATDVPDPRTHARVVNAIIRYCLTRTTRHSMYRCVSRHCGASQTHEIMSCADRLARWTSHS